MMRTLLMLGVGMALVGFTPRVLAQEAEEAEGAAEEMCEKCMLIGAGEDDYCDEHHKGSAFGVEMESKKLFEALAGERLNREEAMKCPGCKTAAETKGYCDKCKVYILVPRGYKSVVAYRLAKGKPVQSEMAFQCDGCKEAWKENGACDHCNLYFAGHRMFKDAESQKEALSAHETLTAAASSKCEACAVAMVMDGTCDHCKVSYKDGKKTSA